MRLVQLFTLSLALLISACGFHLRGLGSFELALTELEFSAADSYSPLSDTVRKRLISQGVNLSPSAEFNLHLGHENYSKRKVSGNPGSHSAEYQITTSLDYRINSGGINNLVQDRVQVQRYLSINQNQASASDEEERLLRKEMRDELVMQLMLRLQALKPEDLQHLKELELRKLEAEKAARAAAELQLRLETNPELAE